jgi:uncharacterized peroxidase-related enzyme
MSRLPLRTIADAPDETKGTLTTAEKTNGFLPNLLRILANAPVALETYLTVSAINARSSLALDEREAVQITAAAVHGCGFCVAGHTAIATKKAEMAPSVIAALRGRIAVDAPRINAVARFTEAVIASRGAVSDGALATFKQAGFDEQAALEVVLGVSLATLCNFANNLGQPPLNEQLVRYQWTPSTPSVAE